MLGKISKRVLVCFMALMIASAPSTAFAGMADGSIASASSGTKNFGTYSRIQTNSTQAIAYQFTRCTNAKVSPGEIGSIARLFSHGGSLTGSSGWQYNGSTYNPGIAIGPNITMAQPKGSSWYAQGSGQFLAWGKYNTITSGRTPYQTVA